ncbi:MAG: tyrosine-protein phosphatase, partial [Oscillospiraceae bacterium]|nr:tyrosine-protein phosphatase [Oscillospiraceae bacterium]
VADYMITRERCAPGTQRLLNNCRKFTDDEAVLEFVYRLDTVQEDFIVAVFETIDEVHGGMDSFLREKMGLDEASIYRLKALYLE